MRIMAPMPISAPHHRAIGFTKRGRPIMPIAGGAPTATAEAPNTDPIAGLRAERATAFAALEAITGTVTAEGRGALTDDEVAAFNSAREAVDELDRRIEAFEVTEARRRIAAEHASAEGRSGVEVTREPEVYSAEAERLHKVSFLRDLANQQRDPAAQDRIIRHHRAHAVKVEERDVGTGAFAGLTVPQYLTDLVAPLPRAGRPLADICRAHPLPPDGMSVNISRITTGTAVAAQATENADTQETNADDTLLTVNVVTIAGKQDVSRQAVDRSTGADSVIIEDLMLAHDTELDRQLIHGDGTGGTHLGILSTTGNVDIAYTDATPTVPELYPKFADGIQQVQTATFRGVSHLVFHPRRWWWIAKDVGTSFPFVQFAMLAPQTAGLVNGTDYAGAGVGPMGVPAILDANISTALGAGTEDAILGVTASELHLWEDANAPLMIRTDEALSNQLSVRFVVYSYSAFTAGRYPASQFNITGTGLIAPTF